VDCGAPSLANGSATPANGVTNYGSTVSYVCNTGYTRSGAQSAECTAEGSWSASATCTPVDCGQPVLGNGKATLPAGTTYGSVVNYACNVGYTRSGPASATCGANRSWSPAVSCNPVTCPALVAPTRGSIITSDGNNFGSTANYSCTSATLAGDQNRTCQANGAWSGDAPKCLFCGDGEATETCDPTAPGWSTWSCTSQCTKRTHYTPCAGNSGMQGIGCDSGQFCLFGACGTLSCVGDASCAAAPTGQGVAMCSNYSVCIVAGCASTADCAPGLTCRLDANPPYCTGCTASVPCPSGKTCNLYIGQSFGRCD
jgi:hypothetical protein